MARMWLRHSFPDNPKRRMELIETSNATWDNTDWRQLAGEAAR